MEIPASHDGGGYFRFRPDTPPQIQDLLRLFPNPNTRERMLSELEQMAPSYPQIGLLLGESRPFMDALLKGIISMHIVPPSAMTSKLANQLSNELQLLQVVICCYPYSGMSYPMECFPRYLMPLLSKKWEEGPLELVLVRTIAVFEAILMARDDKAKHEVFWPFVVPSCLDLMWNGNEESKIRASELLEAILRNDEPLLKTAAGGQLYGAVSLTAVVSVLEKMFTFESYELAKSCFSCCVYLSEYVEACHMLVRRIPYMLNDGYLHYYLVYHPEGSFNESTMRMLTEKVSPFYKYVPAAERAKIKKMGEDAAERAKMKKMGEDAAEGAKIKKMGEDASRKSVVEDA